MSKNSRSTKGFRFLFLVFTNGKYWNISGQRVESKSVSEALKTSFPNKDIHSLSKSTFTFGGKKPEIAIPILPSQKLF